ncbi:MAG: cache domain-containing protein, partial [Treponema sp.]|nr:cache domain-containing protein [Treponema sp.]
MKIGKKLIIMIIALTLSGIGVLLGTILNISQKQITRLADSDLKNLGNNEAGKISLWMETQFSVARALAHSMEVYEQIEPSQRRFFYNMLLRQMVEESPDLASAWTVWEPNALDGMDAQYANTEGTDATGRFLSNWARTASGAQLEYSAGYDESGADFYNIAMRTGEETVVEPFMYNLGGKDSLITSLVVPIKKNGRPIAVVGVDITLSRIQTGVEGIHPYEGSIAA